MAHRTRPELVRTDRFSVGGIEPLRASVDDQAQALADHIGSENLDVDHAFFGHRSSLRKLYTDVVRRLCDSWTYNCDGGCYASLCARITWTDGPWTFVYQPKKGFDEYRTSEISLMFMYRAGPLTDSFVKEHVEPVIADVNDEFEGAFEKLMALTGRQWLETVNGPTVYNLLQIEPWVLDVPGKRYKTTYTLRGSDEGLSCRDYQFVMPGFAGDETNVEELVAKCKKPVY